MGNKRQRDDVQTFDAKECQGKRNKCDREINLWAFLFGFETGNILAPLQLPLFTHTSTAEAATISRFLCNWQIFFLVSTIRQVHGV